MNIEIRPFRRGDIPDALRWAACRPDGRYPRDGPPADQGGAEKWYAGISAQTDRRDFMVELYGTPIGLAGLTDIEGVGGRARLYISMGETGYNNIRSTASACALMLKTAFHELGLGSVYLYAPGAEAAELFRSSGFKAEKTLRLEAGEEQLMSVTAEEFALLEPFL